MRNLLKKLRLSSADSEGPGQFLERCALLWLNQPIGDMSPYWLDRLAKEAVREQLDVPDMDLMEDLPPWPTTTAEWREMYEQKPLPPETDDLEF